ncbi:MAG: Fic family protein [Oscillospiraceae bacterium]|jgi:Fic family protein|nr:Fic family protein [Oscillospiraceae bacterium]
MKTFDFSERPKALLTPDVVAMLTSIHEHKGKQALFIEAHADALTTLVAIAKIQSTGASNAIEGIHTTDKRLEALVRDKSAPRNRAEQEIAGYRDVLATIHESYDYIHPRPNVILQLHQQLYAFSKSAIGGNYKNADNFIAETDAGGKQSVRFQPVPAYLTANAMDMLCELFSQALKKDEHDPLLLIPMFVLDFLCIHPFNDGNGRMSRLLTLLLLYRAGYIVGKYISLEKLIEQSKDTYYEALQDSSAQWHDNESNYLPFIRYSLGILQKAYDEFAGRVEVLGQKGLSKPDRIKTVIDRKLGKITKKEIMETCPDISQVTVERALTALVKAGYLVKIGAGRTVAYGKTDSRR